jgi:thiol:disulfide interchange protein
VLSFALRAGFAGSVLWLLARAGLEFLLLALGGFVLARVATTRLFGRGMTARREQRPCG